MKTKINDILASPHIQRFIKGASWSFIGTVSGKILMLIAFILIARIIGKEDYGKIGVLRSTITMFMVFSSLGMGLTASRYVAFYRSTNIGTAYQIHRASNIISILFGSVICLYIYICNENISSWSFGSTDLSFSLKLTVIALFFSTITSAQNGTLTGFEDFKGIGINNLIFGIIQFVLIIFGALNWGVNGVIVFLGVSSLFLVIFNKVSIDRKFRNVKREKKIFTPEIRNILLKFSIPAMLSTFVAMPTIWLAKSILVKVAGFQEMAVFDVSEQWYMIVLFIPNSIGAIVLPMLSNSLAENAESQYNKVLKLNLVVNCVIVIVLVLFLLLFAPFIVQLYGSNFEDYLPLRILLMAAVLQTVNSILGQVLASKAKMWMGFGVNVFWGICFTVLAYYFLDYLELGALGLSYAFLLSYLLHSILQGYIAFKIIKIS